eukprot:m.293147 g.293147  ORF g.293147 m.293147 type:complete len:95 (+) comp16388_c0_seq36:2770-3054(+)
MDCSCTRCRLNVQLSIQSLNNTRIGMNISVPGTLGNPPLFTRGNSTVRSKLTNFSCLFSVQVGTYVQAERHRSQNFYYVATMKQLTDVHQHPLR